MADGVVAELAALARASGRLGIDTEFMGEGRYRALLCLIQIAVETDDGVRVEVLDPLTEQFDPAPLADLLADPDIQVVLHAGRQDVALLRREWPPSCAASSTPRSPPASPGCARSSATRPCCTRWWACACARARRSRAGTRGR